MFYAIPAMVYDDFDPLDFNSTLQATTIERLNEAILDSLQGHEDSKDDPPDYYLILDAKKVTVKKRLVTRIPATFTFTDV